MNFGTSNEVVTFRQVDFAMLYSFSHNTYLLREIENMKEVRSFLAFSYSLRYLYSYVREPRLRAQLLHAFCSAVEPALFLVSY